MKRSRRIARLVVIAAGILLGALLAAGLWLLGTESGARFAAARAVALIDGLSVDGVGGAIGRGVRIDTLRYADEAIEVEARAVAANLALRSLVLGPPIRLTEVAADALTLRLAPASPDAAAAPEAPPPALPAVAIDRVAIRNVRIERAEAEPIVLDRIEVGVALGGSTITLDALDAEGPLGAARGALTIDLARPIPVAAAGLEASLVEPSGRRWTGRLDVEPRRRGRSARLALAEPVTASLALREDVRRGLAAELSLPRQDGSAIGLEGPIEATLRLAGTTAEQHLEGTVELLGERVAITGGRLASREAAIAIDALALDWDGRGRIAIEGVLPTRDDGALSLALTTDGLALPRGDAAGPLRVSGRIDVAGTLAEPVLTPSLALAAEDLPPGALTGRLAWRAGAAHAETLTLALARGRVVLDGPVGAPEPHVLELTLADLDPGLLRPDWPGRLDGTLRFEGLRRESGFEGRLVLEGLAGELRGRPVRGAGTLTLVEGRIGRGEAAFDFGRARARATVDGPERLDVAVSAPDLGELDPALGGNLEATWRRDGADRLDLRAEALSVGEVRLARLDARATLDLDPDGPLALRADAAEIRHGGRAFESATLAVDGVRNRHRVALAVRGAHRLTLEAEGALVEPGWRGRVTALAVDELARLDGPAELAWDGAALRLGEACLGGRIGRLCLDGGGDASGGEAAARIERLELGALAALLGDAAPARVQGAVSGVLEFGWRDGRIARGEGALRAVEGRVVIPDRADVELGWSGLDLAIGFDGERGTVRGAAGLVPDGRLAIDGGFALAPDGAWSYDVDLDVAVRALDPIEAFTSAIADPEGELSGQFKLRGTLGERPEIGGAVALTGFTAQVPEQAIRVRDGVLVVAGVPDRLVVRGSLRSGDGTIAIDGRIDLADRVPAELIVSGENFRVANSPTLMLLASPDLRLAFEQRRWNLDGALLIPRARIDLERLEGGVSASPDVVVIDDPQAPDPSRPWRARVRVTLGDEVRLNGFGFDGRLAGSLDVRQRQGARATATGQLDVFGTYRAYGQRLTIREGHLRYAASPLDEPTIDLRAERTVRGETVALAVTGNALAPTARVIAAPGMSEEDALAMLVTGRPLRATGSGDRDALSGAASALGLVGGDLLASRLRGSLGLDEFGISNDTALDGEAFTIGKYLSPRLYVGYGIGLLTRGEVFTARFLLTDRLDLEASSGQTQRAAINYRIER
jgi:translocation and assembly module TamB